MTKRTASDEKTMRLYNRSNLEVYAEVLEAANSGMKKSHIANRSRMNYDRAVILIDDLVRSGLLSISKEQKKPFGITEKGLKFLHSYSKIQSLVDATRRRN